MTFGTIKDLQILCTKEPIRRYVVLDQVLTPGFTTDLDQATLFATAHVKEWIAVLLCRDLISNENQVQSVSLRDAMTIASLVE